MTQTATPPTAAADPTWDRVAATRPRVRRDVLCTDTENGAVFHNARGGFALNGRSAYRFASMLLPRLDGTVTVADLCAGLPEGQRRMVAGLVATLYDRGFARDVDPATDGIGDLDPAVAERYAAQLAYLDHYAGDAARRFAAFRTARVAVLGDGEVAAWAALSLVRNGAGGLAAAGADPRVAAEAAAAGVRLDPVGDLAGYDVVVVAPEAGPGPVLDALTAGLPAGTVLLPAWTVGDSVVVGPATRAGVAGCWACAALRLGGRGDAGAAFWSSVALPGTGAATPLGGPLAAMIGNLLGYEVFRLRTGTPDPETRGWVLVQDVASLDVTRQPLLPDPRCPFCPAAGPEPVDRAAVAGWRPPPVAADPADDAESTLAELEARSVLVQPATGPFRRWADDEVTQLPLKVGAVTFGDRTISAVDVRHVAGARLRAVEAAAGAYVERVVPLRAGPAGGPVVETARLGTASGLAGPAGRAVPATSLLTGATRWVPAAAARPFGAENAARVVDRTTAGLGVAPSAAGAVATGLLSALAHRALTGALRRTVGVRAVRPGGDDAELTFLTRSAGTLGVEVELLELAAPVPVLLARTTGDGAPLWALGVATGWREAAVAALRDLLGQVQVPGIDRGEQLMDVLEPAALVPAGPAGEPPADAPVDAVLAALRAEGGDVLVVPDGSADLRAAGLHAARVLLVAGDGG